MDNVAHVDIESFSELPFGGPKSVGVYKYAEHLSTEIMCLVFAIDDTAPELWLPFDPTNEFHDLVTNEFFIPIHWGRVCPDSLVRADQYRAHNSQFERTMLNGRYGQIIGMPRTEIEDWICTAAKAASHNLPRALDKVASAMQLPHQKDKEGHNIMMQLCKPRKPSSKNPDTRWTKERYPEKYLGLYSYCIDDVYTERGIDVALPELPKLEQKVFFLDQLINDRGVRVDTDMVDHARHLIKEAKGQMEERCVEMTGLMPTQTAALKEWIAPKYAIPDLQKQTVEWALEQDDCPTDVKEVLAIRMSHTAKAITKYESIMKSLCDSGKLHGMLLYHGAGTGRWTGLLVQMQNLFTGLDEVDPEQVLKTVPMRDLALMKMLWDMDPLVLLACCIRGVFVADEGHDLLCADLNSIEAIITAWYAGEEEILNIFRTHGKLYEHTAAKMWNMDADDLDVLMTLKKEFPKRRFAGKTATLAFGFGGGGRAYQKFAKRAGMIVDFDEAEEFKHQWRAGRKKTCQFWYDLEDAAIDAVANPGKVTAAGAPGRKVAFKVVGDFLYQRLPSGRRLAYYKPEIDRDGRLEAWGIDTQSRRFMRIQLYGGRLAACAIQGMAADILRRGMFKCEEAGLPIILTVHDEIVSLAEHKVIMPGDDDPELDLMCKLMCEPIEWAPDLPVSADGFRDYRYKK